MKTGLITSDTYQNHDTGTGHPEQIARVSVIIDNFKKLNNKNLLWKKPTKVSDWALKVFKEQAAAQKFSPDLVFSLTRLSIVEFPLNENVRRLIRDQCDRILASGQDPIEVLEEFNDPDNQEGEVH